MVASLFVERSSVVVIIVVGGGVPSAFVSLGS